MSLITPAPELQRYQQQVSKEKAVLGHLFWYSCSSATVPQPVAKAALESVGLGEFAPPPPADSDVFRRVFENGSRRSYDTTMVGVTENLLVRDVVRRGERLVKHIVSELVDSEGEKLSFAECAIITFTKAAPDSIDVRWLDENTHARDFAHQLVNDFHATRGCIGAQAVREIIRRTLESCMCTAVRENGGVFFVSEEHLPKIEALEAFVDGIPGSDVVTGVRGSNVHHLPLVDSVKQRDMVKRAFEAEVTEDVVKLQSEVVSVLKQDGDIADRKFRSLHKRYMHVQKKIAEYQKLLTEQTEVAGDRLDILGKQMGALLNKVA